MAKGVANMPRYREVTLAANRRYLDALSAAGDPGDSQQRLRQLARRVRTKGRSHRGLNPARQDDVELLLPSCAANTPFRDSTTPT